MNMLRKHAESNTNNWNKWLPFIEFSYNSRIHSSTKYSSYELIYGFKMLGFEDWTDEDKETELMVIKRANQEKQRIDKDKRNNVIEEQLAIGSQVRLKVEGLKGKLENRYRRRFSEVVRTRNGNYILKGEIIKERSGKDN